jgi:hypothetical protein
MEQSEDWDRRYLDMSLLEEWSPLGDELSRGVIKMTGQIDEGSLAEQLTSLIPEVWPFDEPVSVPAGKPEA